MHSRAQLLFTIFQIGSSENYPSNIFTTLIPESTKIQTYIQILRWEETEW